MNWSKTKSILIVALLLTNIILFAYLIANGDLWDRTKQSDAMMFPEIVRILEGNHIHVNFENPPALDRVHSVSASIESYDLNTLANKLLGPGYLVVHSRAIFGNKTLEVIQKKELIYSDTGAQSASSVETPDDARKIAEDFLTQAGLMPQGEAEWRMNPNGDNPSEIQIFQTVNQRFIDNSSMRLYVSAKGVYYFERKWFQIQDKDIRELPYTITSPGRALMKLSEKLLEKGPLLKPVSITRMELGYRLDTSVFGSTISSGELSLIWRFTLDDRKPMYINALE